MKLNTKNGFDFGTNILSVKVPDALRTKVKTGVDYIDGSFGGQGMTPQEVLAIAYDPHERSRVSVIGRQAKRAGMTVADWLEHCQAKGHDPYFRDKDIPNHEAAGSRGGCDPWWRWSSCTALCNH